MTGSGNDFVMVDARLSGPDEWTAADMRAACARGTGVGADGLVFIAPGSTPGAARMTYFNSDGSHAAMCGNAALCATRLAARLGLAPAAGMRLETDAGVFESRCLADDHRAELRLTPAEPPHADPGLATVPGERRAVLGVVGVPHLVVLVDDVDAVDLERRGRALRGARALGPPGANVNFISPGARPSQWRMRTYERGVEAETLACGTGAVAAALAAEGWGLGQLPATVITRSGQRLEVSGRRNGGLYDELWLRGEARLVFRGVLT
ncbi:MAG: diaminopimelate epimerase [Gemmatimonadales bacterium]